MEIFRLSCGSRGERRVRKSVISLCRMHHSWLLGYQCWHVPPAWQCQWPQSTTCDVDQEELMYDKVWATYNTKRFCSFLKSHLNLTPKNYYFSQNNSMTRIIYRLVALQMFLIKTLHGCQQLTRRTIRPAAMLASVGEQQQPIPSLYLIKTNGL